ncbi:hypothetical protein ACIBHX_26125 [Nonomuraea sp. NPDC050536]|uniref:hypothetical protein n=1 Tax=Nonomuraea sp. NPDC050536 TaxID=3364366 RepID=UPI0037C97218
MAHTAPNVAAAMTRRMAPGAVAGSRRPVASATIPDESGVSPWIQAAATATGENVTRASVSRVIPARRTQEPPNARPSASSGATTTDTSSGTTTSDSVKPADVQKTWSPRRLL